MASRCINNMIFAIESKVDFETFFDQAPKLNENVFKITGVIWIS